MVSSTVFQLAVVLLGIGGLSISSYLHHKKKTALEDMACPMDGSCEDVITSKFSKFMGCDVEILGMLYYATVVVAYTIFIFTGYAVPSSFTMFVLLSSVFAVLFSAYLTYIQGMELRKWCTWCLCSAGICTLILVFALLATAVPLESVMAENLGFLAWMGITGAALGFGVSVSYDTLTLYSLKDFGIGEGQAGLINSLNQISWASMAAVLVSLVTIGIGSTETVLHPEYAVSWAALAVLIANDSFYTISLSERLQNVYYKEETGEDENRRVRRLVFVFAAVSSLSWAILLSLMIFDTGLALEALAGVYVLAVSVAIFSGIVLSEVMNLRAKEEMPDWSPLH